MKRTIRLTESELIRLVRKVMKEQDDDIEDYGFDVEDNDFGFESPTCPKCKGQGCEDCDGSGMKRNSVTGEKDDDIEDYGFDVEDDDDDFEDFDREMKSKDRMRKNRPSGLGIGAGSRWDKDSEKEYNPIKADDLPLDKFLKSKYNKM